MKYHVTVTNLSATIETDEPLEDDDIFDMLREAVGDVELKILGTTVYTVPDGFDWQIADTEDVPGYDD